MEVVLPFFDSLLGLLPVVAFGAPLIAFIVDQLKRFGAMPDGYAPLASSLLNLALYALLWFAGEENAAGIETLIAALYAIAPFVVSLIVSLWASSEAHNTLANIGIGFSHPVDNDEDNDE